MSTASSTTNELVSILMPYYELGEFLLEAVDSVRAQTYQNWELLIVDDCSPSLPATTVLAEINDPRVKIFRHDENRGCSAGRNTAASHSRGGFFIPLDSDDLLSPNYIEATLNMLKKEDASAVFTDVQIFGMHSYIYTPSADLGDIVCGHYPHNTLIFKRELFDQVGGYKNIKAITDTDFWMSLLETGAKFAHLPEPLYHYRRHPDSWCRQFTALTAAFYDVLLRHLDTTKKHVPRMLEKSIKEFDHQLALREAPESQYQKYQRLHKEFHDLLREYEHLEKQAQKTEEILGSLPQLIKQFSYVTLKRVGLKS
ncbi:MAG: hypothetical protein DKT66_01170 [Candidatus Melainabacteria bacterium]|nr:MAG: hypothetical protein DKT66_01170 [Candidatus Melainabacteria bacterium]